MQGGFHRRSIGNSEEVSVNGRRELRRKLQWRADLSIKRALTKRFGNRGNAALNISRQCFAKHFHCETPAP